ncbi:MAG TPA: DUF6569 family protein [Pirellulales bacterium]|jgi:hypothetical protein|nr:DUF6569 family protein [Pirellulales bacterium]
MRRYLCYAGLLASLGIFAFIETLLNRAAGADAAKPAAPATGDLTVGEPIHYANLTIFPLASRTPRTENRFTTLDEGLKAGTVKVMEIDAQGAAVANAAGADPFGGQGSRGADVNHLALVNHSKKPLYLMPGEIIVGGQQDRTIAQEYVIPPGDKPVTIAVFCVEHGRWVGRGAAELRGIVAANADATISATNSFSPVAQGAGTVELKVDQSQFIGSVGNVSKAARLAVQADKNQGKVWDKVAESNMKNRVESESGDFAGNYLDRKSVERLEPYFKSLDKQVADSANIVGVAVAINGKMDTLDIFESTPLFRQLWPKLLKSYALDAATAAEGETHQTSKSKPAKKTEKTASVDDARKFLTEAMSGRPEKSDKNGDIAITTLSTDHTLTFSAKDASRAEIGGASPAAGLGGYGGAIHTFGGSK